MLISTIPGAWSQPAAPQNDTNSDTEETSENSEQQASDSPSTNGGTNSSNSGTQSSGSTGQSGNSLGTGISTQSDQSKIEINGGLQTGGLDSEDTSRLAAKNLQTELNFNSLFELSSNSTLVLDLFKANETSGNGKTSNFMAESAYSEF